MNRLAIYGLGMMAMLVAGGATFAGTEVFAQLYGGSTSGLTATQEQLKECEELGIPDFECNETNLLAKRRIVTANKEGAYGSGTAMLGKGFGELGIYVAILGAIFGGVAAAFFAMSRKKPTQTAK